MESEILLNLYFSLFPFLFESETIQVKTSQEQFFCVSVFVHVVL